ncbi:MAG TPA: sodium:solute symporter [Vicinamibacteria bacterium]
MALLEPADWAVLGFYLVAIVGFGVYMGRGNRRVEDFFLAGRQMPWWAIGLSVMATQISAITFVGTTGQAFSKGMSFLVVYFGLPFAMVILCVTLVPFFYRAGVYTAYQYLEKRFDGRTRTLTSLLFLISRGLSVGVTLYAPSLVLSVVLGWSEPATILLMGSTTIAYVVYGGNKSVIWTDVVQMVLIWVGVFVCLGVAITKLPPAFGLRDSLALAQTAGRLAIVDTSLDPTKPYTLWSGLIGGFFLALAYFGTDQSQVQRYLSGKSLRESRLSLLFNAFLKIPMQFLILLTGVLVFVFYHFHPQPLLWNPSDQRALEVQAPAGALAPIESRFVAAEGRRRAAAEAFGAARHDESRAEAARLEYLAAGAAVEEARAEAHALIKTIRKESRYDDTNYVFPTYVLSTLRGGLAGLILAVIFAAAMSTLSGELSALATASMVDFYQRLGKGQRDEKHDLLVSRLLTAGWGVFAGVVALQAGRLGSAIEVVNKFGSYFYGSILGVFGLAILAPKADGRGAFWGLLAGIATVAVVAQTTNVAFLWYNPIGAVTVFVVGRLLSARSTNGR